MGKNKELKAIEYITKQLGALFVEQIKENSKGEVSKKGKNDKNSQRQH